MRDQHNPAVEPQLHAHVGRVGAGSQVSSVHGTCTLRSQVTIATSRGITKESSYEPHPRLNPGLVRPASPGPGLYRHGVASTPAGGCPGAGGRRSRPLLPLLAVVGRLVVG